MPIYLIFCLLFTSLAWSFDFFQQSRQSERFSRGIQSTARAQVFTKNTISSDQLIAKFQVANSSPGDFSQDGLQGLSYADFAEVISNASGIPMSQLSLWTSQVDTGTFVVPSQVSSPEENLFEVPLIRRDLNQNQIFDSGDSLYFFGHGSSFWKRVQGDFGPLKYHLSHSPYGFQHSYFLGVLGSGEGLELSNSAGGTPVQTLEQRWYYRHAEREVQLRDNTHKEDDSTGVEWHWIFFDTLDFSSYNITHPSTEDLVSSSIDSAYAWLSYFPLRGRGQAQNDFRTGSFFRWSNVEYSLFVNQNAQTWKDSIRYHGHHLFEISGLQASSNTYTTRVEDHRPTRKASGDSRFDSYTIAFKSDHSYDAFNPYLLVHDYSNSLGIPSSGVEGVFKLNQGEWSAQLPQSSGYFVDMQPDEDTRYFLWDGSVRKPSIQALTPQSLDVSTQVQYLIISPEKFLGQSQALADLRSSGQLLGRFQTQVVQVEDIHNYYSGGRPSPIGIRDYLQYLTSRPGSQLQYLLLVGDTHYDFRNIRQKNVDINVPTFEQEDMATDDFFGILEPGKHLTALNYKLNLAIGRLPIRTSGHFDDYLQKVQRYERVGAMSTGLWRNQTLMTADDFYQREFADGIGFKHITGSERFSDSILTYNPGIINSKIFLSDYSPNGNYEKPIAYRDLLRKLNQGQHSFNFIGHGGVDQLADEKFMDETMVSLLRNEEKLPIMSAFSCQVGRIDRISGTSLAQEVLLYGESGAIAFVAGTRDSYSSPNETLGANFYKNLYLRDSTITLGQAFNSAKSILTLGLDNKSIANTEKYNLFGEPVITLPHYDLIVEIDSIPDTLQALQKVQISGSVSGGTTSGKVFIKVIEQSNQKTFQGEGITDRGSNKSETTSVSVPGKTLYAEVVDFNNGVFSTEFYTPRKISFGDTNAVISAYAWRPQHPNQGNFFKNKITLNGTSDDAAEIDDSEPPEIQAYPCGVNPENTGYYSELIQQTSPACIEFVVSDATGIDFSEAVDEGVSVEIEGAYPRQHANFDNLAGRSATFRVDLGESVSPGTYPVEVRALDILGNYSSKTWTLQLQDTQDQTLSGVYNVPNPMKGHTRFFFKTPEYSDVKIKIFDQRGFLVRTLERAQSGVTRWDGEDRYGQLLANGIYYYKVISTRSNSEGGTSSESKIEKLIISR